MMLQFSFPNQYPEVIPNLKVFVEKVLKEDLTSRCEELARSNLGQMQFFEIIELLNNSKDEVKEVPIVKTVKNDEFDPKMIYKYA